MPKFNETLTTGGFFEIDEKPKQKGNYELDANESTGTIGIYRIAKNGTQSYLVRPTIFSDWTNNSDTPYASYAAAIVDFKAAFFFS